MGTIKTVSNAAKREVLVNAPTILEAETLEEVVKIQGEDLTLQHVKAQLMVSFRAMIRRKLEETDDNGDFVNSEKSIKAEDFTDWRPKLRVTKTAEEKAREFLGALPPEIREQLLAEQLSQFSQNEEE